MKNAIERLARYFFCFIAISYVFSVAIAFPIFQTTAFFDFPVEEIKPANDKKHFLLVGYSSYGAEKSATFIVFPHQQFGWPRILHVWVDDGHQPAWEWGGAFDLAMHALIFFTGITLIMRFLLRARHGRRNRPVEPS